MWWAGRFRAARSTGVLALAVTLSTFAATPARADDAGQKQQKVRERKAQVAGQVNVLKASNQQVQQALDAADANVRGQTAQLNAARQQAAAATIAAQQAAQEAAAALGRLQGARQALVANAIQAYADPQGRGAASAGVAVDDIAEAARKMEYEHLRSGSQANVLDAARAARLALDEARGRAQTAASVAAKRRDDAAAQLARLQGDQQQQQALADAYEQKIQGGIAELGQLDAQDAQLGTQVAQEAAARAAAARAADPSGGGSGGGVSIGPASSRGGISLVTVGGITVNASIAGQVGALLSAASQAGLHLGGSGYRSSADQIALRKAHCGGDVYNKPASACSPPTAKPGSSMHEQGLAIDFTNNGSLISSHGNPAWQWLNGNAGRFGFRNLPSEPWHWSTNGN
jgi:hypothetical protein